LPECTNVDIHLHVLRPQSEKCHQLLFSLSVFIKMTVKIDLRDQHRLVFTICYKNKKDSM